MAVKLLLWLCIQLITRSRVSAASQSSTNCGSVGAKRSRCKKNRLTSTASSQMPNTNVVNSRLSPSPMTIQTRRSSLRSSTTTEVAPKCDVRSAVSSEVKPLMSSPVRPDTTALASPTIPPSVVPVLVQHIRQCVKFWSSKSSAVDVAAAMMKLQPCCSDVIDAVLQVFISAY